jgi:hypothetical protein
MPWTLRLPLPRGAHADSQAVKGSPFEVRVEPSMPEPGRCLACLEGLGSQPHSVEAGQEVTVAVRLRDEFGNDVCYESGALSLPCDALPGVCPCLAMQPVFPRARPRGLAHSARDATRQSVARDWGETSAAFGQ